MAFFLRFFLSFLFPISLFGGFEADFFRACLDGDLEKVIQIYHQEGLKITAYRDKAKNNPLHIACCSKKGGTKKEIVHFLIANNCDVNGVNAYGSTPLFIAVSNENNEATELLLTSKGIKVNAFTYGRTPLHEAVLNQSPSLIRLLLNHADTNPNFGTTDDGATPLHFAAKMGLVEEAQLLIEDPRIHLNASQNDSTYPGATPLHFAAMHGQAQIVASLLKTNRVNVHCTIDRGAFAGFTPLHLAVLNPDTPNTYATVQLLLRAGANPKVKSKRGQKAINLTSVQAIQSLLLDPKRSIHFKQQ